MVILSTAEDGVDTPDVASPCRSRLRSSPDPIFVSILPYAHKIPAICSEVNCVHISSARPSKSPSSCSPGDLSIFPYAHNSRLMSCGPSSFETCVKRPCIRPIIPFSKEGLASLCHLTGKSIAQISRDYVFHGKLGDYYLNSEGTLDLHCVTRVGKQEAYRGWMGTCSNICLVNLLARD